MAASMIGSQLITQLQTINTKPIPQRCAELDKILKNTGSKELRNVIPQILESIFGFGLDAGWGIDLICRTTNSHDFDCVRKFLSPEGPLLTLIYTLQNDFYVTYEFSFNCLPAPTQYLIEDGSIPIFYANKLQFHNYGRPAIILNAYEFYMFHLAYNLVNPQVNKRNANWSNLTDCLFPTLIDDYLNYFLPLNKDSLPSMPNVPSPVRSPVVHTSVSGKSQNISVSQSSSPRLGLLKASFLSAQKQHMQSSPVIGQNETETYRSDMLLQILAEFWLNQNPISIDRQTFSHSPTENFMPSSNHVRLVRMLIKHVHNFVNTAKPDVVSSPYQSQLVSPLDEFKKSVIPHIIQKKLYTFLRYGFDRWPLDCSFRLLLETWLTYIQPWRYMLNKPVTGRRDSDAAESKTVEEKWFTFIEGNLLFYTVLYQEFIQRVLRMDLTTLFNACMLFRAHKVYSLPNLSNMIQRAEKELCSSLRMGRAGAHDLGGSYLSPETTLTLHTQLSELEKPDFQYCLMYSEETLHLVRNILRQIEVAKMTLAVQDQSHTKCKKSGLAALFDVSSWFDDQGGYMYGDMTESELKKLHSYLDTAVSNICYIFEIPAPHSMEHSVSSPSRFELSSFMGTSLLSESATPECTETEDGIQLTPRGRYQLMNKMKRFDIVYQGDPDLQPIRSFENATLVRLLHHFCNYVNAQYGSEIRNLYDRDDIIGRMAQVYFAPPLSSHKHLNSPISSSLKQTLEKPRLSLRVLASYRMLMYLGLLYMVMALWWGCGPVGFFFSMMVLVLLYGFFVALTQRSKVKLK